jgi:dienelactone hydrolase
VRNQAVVSANGRGPARQPQLKQHRPKIAAAACITILISACASNDGPWYDTEPDPDLSYLPLGDGAVDRSELTWLDPDGTDVYVDAYLPGPALGRAPVVVMLPGAFVVKERYQWLGTALASHGIATFVVQPPDPFSRTIHTLGTLDALEARQRDPGSPLFERLDLGRLLLAGHSAGSIAQIGLTDVQACAPGFCQATDQTPPSLRGLVLLGFHNQNTADDHAPMAAVESPWLIIAGSRDGLATPEKVDTTFARLQDRPAYLISVDGANHYQMTDYVDIAADLRLAHDGTPDISSRAARAAAATYITRFARRFLLDDAGVAADLDAASDQRVTATVLLPRVTGPSDHGLPRVLSEPSSILALDLQEDLDVVASAWFQGDRYLLVRNEQQGAEVWRLRPGGASEQLRFPGALHNGFTGNRSLNGLLGAMKVFAGKLWVGVSSGYQGGSLGSSTGAELWTFDGRRWRPAISRSADVDQRLIVSGLRGCSEKDESTAELIVRGASFTPGLYAAAGARVFVDDIGSATAGERPVVLSVVDNTAHSLLVQANQLAGVPEPTLCEGLALGHELFLREGIDESGFGEPWNKAIVSLEVFDDRLFVGTGLNYEHGAELYVTVDGERFELAVPREFWGTHPDGSPITSSISALHASDIAGEPMLYIGAVGTKDHGARLAVYNRAGKVRFLIDHDAAGLGGDGMQISSIATFRDRLWISVFSFSGLQIFSSRAPLVGAWRAEVGGNGAFAAGWGDPAQVTGRFFPVGDELWFGSVVFVQLGTELTDKSAFAWRTVDGERWQLATAHAFGVNAVSISQIFRYDGAIYAIAGSGAPTNATRFRPLQLYTLRNAQ